MDTILILLVLTGSQLEGIYLGTFETPKACTQKAHELAKTLKIKVDAATLMCVPKNEV